MTEDVQRLHEGALSLSSAGGDARAWVRRVAQEATSVSNEANSLIAATRKAENLARKLASASGRRNSAGVFGPSQAGKSYLVSVLGRSKDRPLMVDFAGTSKNFIAEINPEGGKEATGLVTRFTVVEGTRDSTHPVELRMLSETDLVKVLGNSFLSDFDHGNRKLDLPEEDVVRSVVAKLEAIASAQQAHLDEIMMFDIGEYFAENFSSAIDRLTRGGYWDALTNFGHRLDAAGRVELFSLLWGQNPDITRVFKLLQQALSQIGFAPTARSAIDSLVPRDRSIIDVDIVKNLLGTEEDAADTISVVPERADGTDGKPVKLPRATLCALVAELKVVMHDRPWDFFEHTDLLDFPGARSREKMIDLPSEADEREFAVRNMLLRGKIAYLFQRYTEERELTCMLLCMPPSNQEVKDLTSLVRTWVAHTHGAQADARAKLPCALFFILTKFDMELGEKPGDTPESWRNRIDTRLEASMYQLYKQEDWLQNWDGKPFSNTLFLRNPGFKLDGIFEYADSGSGERTETGISKLSVARIEANRQGMIDSATCQKHFSDPAGAWDAAMALNDGGVGYLVERLERVLSPKLKTMQLAGRLTAQARDLDDRLRRFYQADDDASRREREEALLQLRRRLHGAFKGKEFREFPHLLSRMMVSDDEFRETFLNVASLRIDDPALEVESQAEPVETDPWEDDPWAADEPAEADSDIPSAPAHKARQKDRFDLFATQIINLWTERVRNLSAQDAVLSTLGLERQAMSDLANELVVGAHRLCLGDQIAERVRSQVAAPSVLWDQVADRCATIASNMVNDYVSFLGYGGLPEMERPACPEPPKPRAAACFRLLI
ncbi:MAG: virulence factor SrfC family protein [Burkholderiaceae bacterium]